MDKPPGRGRRKEGCEMAKSVSIKTEENATRIIIDGNEINDVVSYQLSESADSAFLEIKIAILGVIEALL